VVELRHEIPNHARNLVYIYIFKKVAILHFTVGLQYILLYILFRFVRDWAENLELYFSLLFYGIVFVKRAESFVFQVAIQKLKDQDI